MYYRGFTITRMLNSYEAEAFSDELRRARLRRPTLCGVKIAIDEFHDRVAYLDNLIAP